MIILLTGDWIWSHPNYYDLHKYFYHSFSFVVQREILQGKNNRLGREEHRSFPQEQRCPQRGSIKRPSRKVDLRPLAPHSFTDLSRAGFSVYSVYIVQKYA